MPLHCRTAAVCVRLYKLDKRMHERFMFLISHHVHPLSQSIIRTSLTLMTSHD